jgi:hypothetical protein
VLARRQYLFDEAIELLLQYCDDPSVCDNRLITAIMDLALLHARRGHLEAGVQVASRLQERLPATILKQLVHQLEHRTLVRWQPRLHQLYDVNFQTQVLTLLLIWRLADSSLLYTLPWELLSLIITELSILPFHAIFDSSTEPIAKSSSSSSSSSASSKPRASHGTTDVSDDATATTANAADTDESLLDLPQWTQAFQSDEAFIRSIGDTMLVARVPTLTMDDFQVMPLCAAKNAILCAMRLFGVSCQQESIFDDSYMGFLPYPSENDGTLCHMDDSMLSAVVLERPLQMAANIDVTSLMQMIVLANYHCPMGMYHMYAVHHPSHV